MQRTMTVWSPLLLLAILTLATPLIAQAQSRVDEQQLLLARIQTERQAIVFKSMDLDDAQAAAFTPIYDSYDAQYKKIMDRAVALIDSFTSNYDSMTDDAAERLLKDWFKLKDDEDKLLKKYAKEAARALPPTKVLRFVQLENKLSTLLRLEALQGIPLVK